MLGPGQPDPFGAEFPGHPGIMRGVRVGAHIHPGMLLGQIHEFAEVSAQLGIDGGNLSFQHVPGGSVQGNPVPLLEYLSGGGHGPGFVIDLHTSGT